MTDLQVVFGAGAIGRALTATLTRRGHQVRVVSRHGSAALPPTAQALTGDARDPAFTTVAARGAAVVYQTLNPGYDRWTTDFPALQAAVLAAAARSGARLVSLDNTYMYGPPDGRPFTEDHPYRPNSRKGRVRAKMATELIAAHEQGQVQVAIGLASDYFGAGGGAQSPLGDRVMPAALAGRTAQVLRDPDQPHTYTYLPDIAEALAVLGEHPDAPGQVWHLPNDPDTRTTRQLLEVVYRLAGHPGAKLRSIPAVLLRLLGIVDKPVGEVVEMLYQFQAPFIVDSTKIADKLGVQATPLAVALAATLDSYRPRGTGP